MSNTQKFIKAVRRFSTTIGAGGVANGTATTVPLTLIPAVFADGDPIEFIVDRVSTTGDLTPDYEETIMGIVSGSNVITCDRGVEGTAQAHAAGRVVEIKLTADMWNKLIDGLLAEHNIDGTHHHITATDVTADLIGSLLADSTPDTDHNSKGIKTTLVAHEAQAFGDPCYINADGEAQIGDADAIATASAIAICVDATVAANATGNYLLIGIARDDTWTWTPGEKIYLSTAGTSGSGLTQTAPSGADDVIQILGVATHADRIFFNPQLVQVEHT